MELLDFLNTVITTNSENNTGYFCLASAEQKGDPHFKEWHERWYKWPKDSEEILHEALSLAPNRNVYFSAHLSSVPSRSKEHILPTRTIQADLDHADIYSLRVQPTVLVETSPRRYQAYWVIRKDDGDSLTTSALENFSKRMTYDIQDADRSGWSLGHLLRLPFTLNHKYDGVPFQVSIVEFHQQRVELSKIDTLLNEITYEQEQRYTLDATWLKQPHELVSLGKDEEGNEIGPYAFLKSLHAEKKVSDRVLHHFRFRSHDRSTALFEIVAECLRDANLSREVTYHIAWLSENNKWNHARDMRKDILRIEKQLHDKSLNLRAKLAEIRKNDKTGSVNERLEIMAAAILLDLKQRGKFFNSEMNQLYYVNNDRGRPFEFGVQEELTGDLFTSEYGVNRSTSDYRHIAHNITADMRKLPPETKIRNLSFYDESSESLLIHGGSKDIFYITKDNIAVVQNGRADVLFRQGNVVDPFRPSASTELTVPWNNFMFDSSLTYVVGMPREQALALTTVWFMYLLFRELVKEWPIFCVLGQYGSGKSTYIRMPMRVLYGGVRDLHALGSIKDYDTATSNNPLVAFDGLDNPPEWLETRLSIGVAGTQQERRGLYTNNTPYYIKCDAFIALSAMVAPFRRPDLPDRCIILNFERRPENDRESLRNLTATLLRNRNALWYSIIKDVQRILRTPVPNRKDIPGFRIQDFATVGTWIARGLDVEKHFVDGIKSMGAKQDALIAESEGVLMNGISNLIKQRKVDGRSSRHMLTGELWNLLISTDNRFVSDIDQFKREYKTQGNLSKVLFNLVPMMRRFFKVEIGEDRITGGRTWLFDYKEENNGGVPKQPD